MITIPALESISAVENLYGSLSRSKASKDLRIGAKLRGNAASSRACLMQFLITWAKQYPDARLVTRLDRNRDLEASIYHLAGEEHGILSLLLADNVETPDAATISQLAHAAAKRAYFHSFQQPKQFGSRFFLLISDTLVPVGRSSPFLRLSRFPRTEQKLRFANFFQSYLRSIFDVSKTVGLDSRTGLSLGELVFELLANTEEWGSVTADGSPLVKSMRGLFVNIHLPRIDTGIPCNESVDPHHIKRYFSEFPQFQKGKGALLELSIFDSGIGLAKQWLKADYSPEISISEEYAAVTNCFAKHATSSASSTRGNGLFYIMRLLTQARGYLRFRGGRLALFRDFTIHPHPYADRREPPPIRTSGEGRSRFEFLLDWKTGEDQIQANPLAEGALFSVWLPLIEVDAQLKLLLQ